jgi:hypothetical protein
MVSIRDEESERFGNITLPQLVWDWGRTSGKRSKTHEKI